MLAPWFVAAALASAAPPSACADPAIVAAVARPVGTDPDGVRTYRVNVTVANLGRAGQPDTLLPSLVILQDGAKVGQKGLRPLRPGQRQTVAYTFERSADAARHTTHLTFRLALTDPHGRPVTDCDPGNDVYRLSV